MHLTSNFDPKGKTAANLKMNNTFNIKSNENLNEKSVKNNSFKHYKTARDNYQLSNSINQYGPFLNTDYDKINKKVEIKNPKVAKLLKEINYYGPYYSHCPSCSNKNLDFFKSVNNNQAISILKYIKEQKEKNPYESIVKSNKYSSINLNKCHC